MHPPRPTGLVEQHMPVGGHSSSDLVSKTEDGHRATAVVTGEQAMDEKRGPKRQKSSTSQIQPPSNTGKRRRAGKLRNLPQMPIDILFEVFAILHTGGF
jgi:hypothetical protein